MTGYTQTELDDVQAKWGLRFPPDLMSLYRERRYVIAHPENVKFQSFDWISAPDSEIRGALDWPLEGFLFDIEHELWWPEWGEMPEAMDERRQKLRSIFETAPKLIPIYGHRYIPEEPNAAGNPIFSVYQMDVIHYGANLDDYIRRELRLDEQIVDWPPIKDIRFWTRAVEFNSDRFKSGGGFAFFNKNGVLPE